MTPSAASGVTRADGEPYDGPGQDGHHAGTGECFACMVGVSTGPESHGDRCPLAVTSSAQAPEPTDEQRAVALSCGNWRQCDYEHLGEDDRWLIDNIARALAAAVQQERDKVAEQRHCVTCECMCHCGYVIDSIGCEDWHERHPHSRHGVSR